MAKTNSPNKDARGLYYRNLGWVLSADAQAKSVYPRRASDIQALLANEHGDSACEFPTEPCTDGLSQKKFYLGREEDAATLANMRLESLWRAVCKRHERIFSPRPTFVVPSGENSINAIANGDASIELKRQKPIWDETTLQIAESIRSGRPTATVAPPQWLFAKPRLNAWTNELEKIPTVGIWLEELRRDFEMIHIVLSSGEMMETAELQIQGTAESLVRRGHQMMKRPGNGQKLHSAFKAFATRLQKQNVSQA